MRKAVAIAIALICVLSSAFADDVYPKPDWKEKPNPLASPHAVVGGQIIMWGGPSPKSLNYYLDNNTFSAQVFTSLYDTLLAGDPLTVGKYEPWVAEKWSISDDKKTFTFWMNPKAKWSDGKPITTADVKWTFDTIMDPKNLTGPFKVYFGRFNSPEIIGENQIKFTAKEVHWSNLDSLAGLTILPKHVFEKKDFNLVNFEFPVISGPYKLQEIKEGISISLSRRSDYWNIASPRLKGVNNFQTIRFKMYEERENAWQAFQKGEIDLFPVYTARVWAAETQGEKYTKNWIVKQKIKNHNPYGFQGFAMNMRKPPFDDVKVRKAMAMLLNREKMNQTLMYNQYFLLKSYYGPLYDAQHPNPNEQVKFDKEGARALLKEAGWKANPATGILEKNGKPFQFKFLLTEPSTEKFTTIYSEDLKDVGIRMDQDLKDRAAATKDLDEFNYQMTWQAFSGATRHDPEPLWHSKEADRVSGSNFPGYKSKAVDELIEKQKSIFDPKKQEDVVRQIDQIIYKDYPYALLWTRDTVWLLYWNKFGTPPAVLSKYGDESAALSLWWADEDSEADLEDAMSTAGALSKKPADVNFDMVFKPAK